MSQLPMPSDVHKADALAGADAVVEPPSVKLVVRLFIIPLLIVAAAVGVMFLIGLLAGRQPSFEEALSRLKNPGGGRTAQWLLGPGSKQRYMDAKTLTDKMKSGLSDAERVKISQDVVIILENYTKPDEGEVQHFLLLALGRVWQLDPSQAGGESAEAAAARQSAVQTLLRHARSESVATRKAGMLASVYLAGREEVGQILPVLTEKVTDPSEDLDVRLAAATALGPLGSPDDQAVVEALEFATRDADPRNAELVWAAALSLAQLNQPQIADTILMLMDRSELAELRYYDRETDARNPTFRPLSDQEQQRILINTMLGAKKLRVDSVQQRLKELAASDPSPRVRAAGREILGE